LNSIEYKLSSLVTRPIGEYKLNELTNWLVFIEHNRCKRIISSEEIDQRIKLWCWLKALDSIKDPWLKYPIGYYDALHLSIKQARIIFPELMRSKFFNRLEVTWTPQLGCACDMKVIRHKTWLESNPSVTLSQILTKNIKYLQRLRDINKTHVVKCNRASSFAVKREQCNRGYNEKIFICSAAKGAGLAAHTPFLQMLITNQAKEVILPDKGRLGRSSWKGVIEILKTVGVACVFEKEGLGRKNGHQSSKLYQIESKLAGIVVLPAWLGVGEKIGNVAIVSAEVGRKIEAYDIFPGNDWRVEHILLKLALTGINRPVRIGNYIDGNVNGLVARMLRLCGEKVQ